MVRAIALDVMFCVCSCFANTTISTDSISQAEILSVSTSENQIGEVNDKEALSLMNEYTMEELLSRKKRYQGLTAVGATLIPIGVVSFIFGTFTASQDIAKKDSIYMSSIFFMLEGVVAFGGGIAMTGIMGKKVGDYRRAIKLKSLAVRFRENDIRFRLSMEF